MRLRWQRRVRKQMSVELRNEVSKLSQLSTLDALRSFVGDLSQSRSQRHEATQLLGIDGGDAGAVALLRVFMEQSDPVNAIESALAIKQLADRRTVPPLIPVLLADPDPHRRTAAAIALSWYCPDPEAARALAQCLSDPDQPVSAREHAAEGLQTARTPEAIEALLSAASDRNVVVRFWAAFGLGGWVGQDPRAIHALEWLLDDTAHMPDSFYWSVGKEALGMLASIDPYRERCKAEIARILANESAAQQDRNWAEFYSE